MISKTCLDDTKNYAPNNLGDVLILGLGVSGIATAKFAISQLGTRVSSVSIYAGNMIVI